MTAIDEARIRQLVAVLNLLEAEGWDLRPVTSVGPTPLFIRGQRSPDPATHQILDIRHETVPDDEEGGYVTRFGWMLTTQREDVTRG